MLRDDGRRILEKFLVGEGAFDSFDNSFSWLLEASFIIPGIFRGSLALTTAEVSSVSEIGDLTRLSEFLWFVEADIVLDCTRPVAPEATDRDLKRCFSCFEAGSRRSTERLLVLT